MAEKILQGLRILDLTRVLAGPYTTRILADFGAEVIKVQSEMTATGAESNTETYFRAWNRNKRSIVLDLSFKEARELFLKLVEISDVLVENFSPRVMFNWDFDYDRLKRVNPGLVMLSMSGMGQTGPWKNFVAFGPTLQSLCGLTYLTSYCKDEPVGLGYAYSDLVSGIYGALAILSALEFRDRTGLGQHIDLSEYEAVCTTIGPTLMDASVNQVTISPKGNDGGHLPAAPYGCYKCSGEEKWCVIAVYNEDEWQELCRILGNSAWTKEKRFSTLPMRKMHKEELDRNIETWTAMQSAKPLVQRLQQVGISAGLVQDAENLDRDPQLQSKNFFVPIHHPTLGWSMSERSPIRFMNKPIGSFKASPLFGEDSRYVYEELLRLSKEKILSYKERGIIA